MKALNCLLWMVVAFDLVLRLTGSTRGIRPTGDLIAMSAILLRLLIHLRLKTHHTWKLGSCSKATRTKVS